MIRDTAIRMEAVKAATAITGQNDDIGNFLIHAEWIASYIRTGYFPEAESEQSIVTRSVVVAA
jgi:hypothetical protein